MKIFACFRVTVPVTLLLLAPSLAFARGGIELVEDLNPASTLSNDVGAARPSAVGSRVVFAGRDAEHGVELWRTSGSAAGTDLVKDINPGPTGSFPTKALDIDGVGYFVADDGEHGEELWRTDGTSQGTRLVRDIMPGPGGSDTWNLVEMNGVLYFNGDDGVAASELWRSDGTTAGTRLIKDIWPGPEHGAPARLAVAGNRIFFVADDGEHGNELWVTDGTAAGTRMVMDIRPGFEAGVQGDRRPPLIVVGNQVFFTANDGVRGEELWKSDGTAQGTTLVRDIVPGAEGSDAFPRVAFGGRALFVVVDEDANAHLWSSDGTEAGTQLIVEVGPHRNEPIVESGGKLYFVARRGQLWTSDGTRQGTTLVGDVRAPIGCASNHYYDDLTPAGDRIYLVARRTGRDIELWTSDGTEAGTHEVHDIVDPGGGAPRDLAMSGDEVYFVANDRQHGVELWKSDGTDGGTSMVADLSQATASFFGPESQDEKPLAPVGQGVFFRQYVQPEQLYRSDGSADGTGIVPGTESLVLASRGFVSPPVAGARGQAYFWVRAFDGGLTDLWRSDGTRDGTRLLQHGDGLGVSGAVFGETFFFASSASDRPGDELRKVDGDQISVVKYFPTASGAPGPDSFAPAASQMYFRADDGVHGSELWRTDGTEAGTRLVKDIGPGSLGGIESQAIQVVAGDLLYFVAYDTTNGRELWRSDGTEAGTFLVEDLDPGVGNGIDFGDESILAGTPSGRLFLFTDRDDEGDFQNYDLWTSDGSQPGLEFVARVELESFREPALVTLGEVAYFAVDDDEGRSMLWQSDGTTAGTHRFAKEIAVDELNVVGGGLYLLARRASRDRSGGELWASDGTAAGTQRVAGLAGDFASLRLASLTSADGRLYIVGDDGVHGTELFVLGCGDGRVRDDEQCDDGIRNGTDASSCSLACELAQGGGRRWHRLRSSDGPPPGGGPVGPRPTRGRRVPTR